MGNFTQKYTKHRILPLIFLMVLCSWIAFFYKSDVGAVSATDWKAGRIIDDALFYDSSSMSVDDIQNFLNLKVASCDTYGTQPASEYGRPDLTHAQYAATKGWPAPPYICLRDYYQVPRSDQLISNFGTNIRPSGSISAAQIIKNAADLYGISQKALLVTLQKESPGPLLTDNWPLLSQYKNAMGYGCPDTAPCDPVYEGFYNQMTNAARQFKLYKDNPNNYRYKTNQINSIQWNPNLACGSSNIYIENYATAGLYNYTPYQPNQAALNNLYGTGDSCSAYGNRNFWRIYNDWFGPTMVDALAWRAMGQGVYKDEAKTKLIGWNSTALAGEKVYVRIVVKNTGTTTWTKDTQTQVKIGTWYPKGRISAVCDQDTWISCNIASIQKEQSVAPGENASFEFWAKTPSTPGMYGEAFNLVSGDTWMQTAGTYLVFNSERPTYKWSPVGQTIYTDNTKQIALGWNAYVTPNQKVYAVIKVKNTGNVAWSKTNGPPIQLGTWYPQDRNSIMCDSSTWINCFRPATHTEDIVHPGEVGTFEFWMQSPNSTGNYGESFNIVAKGVTWMPPMGLYILVKSAGPTYSWSFVSQATYSDPSRSQKIGWHATAAAGTKVYVTVKAKNTGNVVWNGTAPPYVQLGTWMPMDHTSTVCDPSTWIRCNRVITQSESKVYPGQIATFNFTAQMPSVKGEKYGEVYNLLAQGVTWMNPTGLYILFTAQ